MLMLMWQRWGDEALLNQCNFVIHWSTLLMLVMMFYWHWFWLCTCATLYCQYIALSWHICDRLHIHHILLDLGLFFLLSSRAHIFLILFQKQPFTPKNIKFGQILAWTAHWGPNTFANCFHSTVVCFERPMTKKITKRSQNWVEKRPQRFWTSAAWSLFVSEEKRILTGNGWDSAVDAFSGGSQWAWHVNGQLCANHQFFSKKYFL